MPKTHTKRSKILREFGPNEEKPSRVGLFRHGYIAVAANLSAAGLTSDRELAAAFHVTPKTIYNWRQQFPRFQQAIDGGHAAAVARCNAVIMDAVDGGDVSAAFRWLERRHEPFKPSGKVEHSGSIGTGETLQEHLERRAQTIDDLVRAGKLRYVEREDGEGEG